MEPLRIGVLGAARITGLALAGPARTTGDRLVTVAARDRSRAEAFAAEHGVERVVDTYADVLADPEVEVVYNPLANSLHGPGTWPRSPPAGTCSPRSPRPATPPRPPRSATPPPRPA